MRGIIYEYFQICQHKLEEKAEQIEEKIKQESKKFVYYFAYGSTINREVLEEKIGRVDFVCKAILPGYQLTFAGTLSPFTSRATIIPNYPAYVEGAVYKINRNQLAKLDQAKGNDCFCHRIRLRVKKDSLSAPIPVELHIFDYDFGIFYRSPNKKYFEKMLQGAQDIGVSQNYSDYLQKHAMLTLHPTSKL